METQTCRSGDGEAMFELRITAALAVSSGDILLGAPLMRDRFLGVTLDKVDVPVRGLVGLKTLRLGRDLAEALLCGEASQTARVGLTEGVGQGLAGREVEPDKGELARFIFFAGLRVDPFGE